MRVKRVLHIRTLIQSGSLDIGARVRNECACYARAWAIKCDTSILSKQVHWRVQARAPEARLSDVQDT